VQDAVIRNLEFIGEASHHIERHDPAFACTHPELPLAYQHREARRGLRGPSLSSRAMPP
jgi:uncharacterized protein with HEPN domain